MNRALKIVLLVLIAAIMLPDLARADYWTRVDRPFSNAQLKRAIAYCRLVPQVNPDTTAFVDMVMGQEIDKCMHSLGWIGLARWR
jgi:hypothetical protein